MFLSTITSIVKATLFIRSHQRLYIMTENKILLYTKTIMYFLNNDTTKCKIFNIQKEHNKIKYIVQKDTELST